MMRVEEEIIVQLTGTAYPTQKVCSVSGKADIALGEQKLVLDSAKYKIPWDYSSMKDKQRNK